MNMGLINDAHCHLYAYGNSEMIKKVIESSPNIKYICENATSAKNFDIVVKLAKKYPNRIIPSIGIHPLNYKEWGSNIENIMKNMLLKDKNIMVGEIGLDFVNKETDKKEQIKVFKAQLEIGIQFKRTISIHSVRSHGDMLKVLKKIHKIDSKLENINLIMHSYSGPPEIMNSLLKLNKNIYFSFSLGIVSSSNKECLKMVPLENILVETDSPYQLNDKISNIESINNEYCEDIDNSKINLPNNSIFVISHIAEVRGINFDSLIKTIDENFKRAFNV